MLSKAKSFCSLSPLQARWCLNSFRQDYYISYLNGVTTKLQCAFCTVPEPNEAEAEDSTGISESPELPGWVKFSENTCIKKPEDDDFLPPSVSYWIENHSIHDQDAGMKHVVNYIVETDIDKISKILKNCFRSPDLVVKALDGCGVDVSESLVEQVLKRFSCEWIPALGFFKWAELQKGVKHSPVLYNTMVDNLGKMRIFDIMWEMVDEMNSLGYVTLDTMTKVMRRFAKAGKYDDAEEVFKKLERFGLYKDVTAMNILMDALVKQGSVEHAERVFLEFKNHIPPTTQTYNILIHGWCKIRKIDNSKKTLEEMKANGFAPDSVTHTCFIEAYCREKEFNKVDATLAEMQKNGFRPSVVAYTIIMTAYGKAKDLNKALEIYETMKLENYSLDAPFYSAFIYALSKCGMVKDAEAVFEDMSKQGITPDLFTFNSMIKTATLNLQEEKALMLLLKMEGSGCKPDLNTYAPLLKMCCKLKRMKVLSFLLNHMFKSDVSIDLGTYSLLVVGLSKKGKLELACSFFKEMVKKGFVPMDCTCTSLVGQLEKKGMHTEKQCIEDLMLHAKQQGSVHPSRKIS